MNSLFCSKLIMCVASFIFYAQFSTSFAHVAQNTPYLSFRNAVPLLSCSRRANSIPQCIQIASDFHKGHVRRRKGERYSPCCVQEADTSQCPNVMVWAGISFNGRTDLLIIRGNLNALRYRDEILHPIVLYPMQVPQKWTSSFCMTILQDHIGQKLWMISCKNRASLGQSGQQSPNLSPIENIWHVSHVSESVSVLGQITICRIWHACCS